MVVSYVTRDLHTLRAGHRYVLATSDVAITSAQLVLNGASSPAPVAGTPDPIALHVEHDSGVWKMAILRAAGQTIGGDYFLRLDGSNSNVQIDGADAVFHLHSGLDISTVRKTALAGTDLANDTAITLGTTQAGALNLLAFESDGLPLLSVVAEGGTGTNTAMVIEYTDDESLLSVSGSGTSADPFVVAFDGTWADLTAAQKTMYESGRVVSITVSDSVNRVVTGFFKVYRFADPAMVAETTGGVYAQMAQNYTTYSGSALHLPVGAAYRSYYTLSITAGVGYAGTSIALGAPADGGAQFVAADNTAKDASGIIVLNYNQDSSRANSDKFSSAVPLSLTQTVGALSRTWTNGYGLITLSAAAATHTSSDAAALTNFGVFTLRTISSVVAGGATSRCLRSQVGGGNVTVAVSVVNGFGNSTTAYSFSDNALSASSVSDSALATMTSPISGNITNNAYLSSAEQITCTGTVLDVGLAAPTGAGAAYPVISSSDVLSVYENIEANLKEGSGTTAYTANRASFYGSVVGTYTNLGGDAYFQAQSWWTGDPDSYDAARDISLATPDTYVPYAYGVGGQSHLIATQYNGLRAYRGVNDTLTFIQSADGLPAVFSKVTSSAAANAIDLASVFKGGYGTLTYTLNGVDVAYASIQGTNLQLAQRNADELSPYTLSITATDQDGNALTVGDATPATTAIPAVYQRTFPASDYIGATLAGQGAAVAYWYSAATLSIFGDPAFAASANSPSGASPGTAGSEASSDRYSFDNFPEVFPLAVTGSHPAANNYSSYLGANVYSGTVLATGAAFTPSNQIAVTLGAEVNNTITSATVGLINSTNILDINAGTFTIRLTLPQIDMPTTVSSNISTIQSLIEVQGELVIDVMVWLFTLTSNIPQLTVNYNSETVASNAITSLSNETDGQLLAADSGIADLAPAASRIVMQDQDLRITSGYESRLIVVATGSATTPDKAALEALGYTFTVAGAVQNNSNTTDLEIISGGQTYAQGLNVPEGSSATITLQINANINEVAQYTGNAATAVIGGASVRYYYLVLSAVKPLVIPVLITSMGHLTSLTIGKVDNLSFADSFSGEVTASQLGAAPNNDLYDWYLYQANSALTQNPPAWGAGTANSWVIKSGSDQTQAQISAALKNLPTRRWKADGTGVNTGAPISYAYMVAARAGADVGTVIYSNWAIPTPAHAGQFINFNDSSGSPQFMQSTNMAGTSLITAQRADTTEAAAPALDQAQVHFEEISRANL